jgi:hypothetical protein
MASASPLIEVSERAPPYFRFLLSPSLKTPSIPPSVPPAMERLPIENWTAFWSRIHPIATRVTIFDMTYYTFVGALYVTWLVLAFFYLPTIRDTPYFYLFMVIPIIGSGLTAGGTSSLSFIPFWMVLPLLGATAFHQRIRQMQLESIRKLCREEEERTFRSHGFTLECDDEMGFFNLYFLPWDAVADMHDATVQNGYLRLEVLKSSPAECGWSSTLLPALDSYESLPIGFGSLPQDDWAEFRSKFIEVSRECQSTMHLLVVTEWTMIVLFCSMWVSAFAEYDPAFWVIFILAILSLCVEVYVSCRVQNLIKKPPIVVAEYAAKFAQQGVYVEYRKHLKFHWCGGPYVCHYVYLFPPATPNLVLPEEHGSIERESSFTSRSGGNAMV